MHEQDESLLIAIVVVGNLLLMAGLLLLITRGQSWRQRTRGVWEVTLVTSVYFGVGILGMVILVSPIWHWLVLHSHYGIEQIHAENLRIEQIIRPNTVVFSNGERRSIGVRPNLIIGALFFCWWGFDVWITRRIARRFAPTVWAEFPENRNPPA